MFHHRPILSLPSLPTILLLLTVAACGDGSGEPGSLTVLVEPEDAITEGLVAGDGPADIRDGWSVAFERYLVTLGDVDVHRSTDAEIHAADERLLVVDLTRLPAAGVPLWSIVDLEPGRWELAYATPGAADGSLAHDSVPEALHDQMIAEDWTYWIQAELTNLAGESCPPAALVDAASATPNGRTNGRGDPCYDHPVVRIDWGVSAETRYGPCEVDGLPGFAMAAGGSQTVALSIHGDHLFFNGFPDGGEGGVMRLAQWVADADLDLDGEVTRAELEALMPADLASIDERYALGAAPIVVTDMWDYVVAQLKTQGHFQGEGECAIDGEAHDH